MLETMFDSISSDPNAGVPDPGKPADLIVKLLPYIFGVAGIILLFRIISNGLQLMTAAGNLKVIEGVHTRLTHSAIGILILFTSFWIVQLVMKFFGISTVLFN